jgi:hypothetical protein
MRSDGTMMVLQCYSLGEDYSDGLFLFEQCNSDADGKDKFDYLSPDGRVILEVSAVAAESFSEGLAAIEDKNKRWGYIDKKGNVVIQPRFEEAEPFSDGLARVTLNDHQQYINTKGETILVPRWHGLDIFEASPFSFGVALISFEHNTSMPHFDVGLIDHSGRWVIEPTPKLIVAAGDKLRDGLAPILSEHSDKAGFINQFGKLVIQPRFSWGYPMYFQEGLAVVSEEKGDGAKKGFIDLQGKWAISPTFDDAGAFCDGLAPVKISGQWGFIDKNGHVVIEPKYDDAGSFDGGVAAVDVKGASGLVYGNLINKTEKVIYHWSKPLTVITFGNK